MPKQFLTIVGDMSTYQATLKRVSDNTVFRRPIVVTNDAYRFHARTQAEEIGVDVDIVLEPVARDSAPAIAAASAFACATYGEDAIVLTLAADHIILDDDFFVDACLVGSQAAAEGEIVTFGIHPTEPRTSYGYIRPGDASRSGVFHVAAFVEKPDLATARAYVTDGYLWNSGNFLFRVDVLKSELERIAPDVSRTAEAAVAAAERDLGFIRLGKDDFAKAPKISFDYCVMEKTDRASVVPVRWRWSDIGSWSAVGEVSTADKDGNVVRGTAELLGSTNCVIHAEHGVVGAIGVHNLVVSVTEDAILVADRETASEVKELVARFERRNHPEATEHPLVRRPWGSYRSLHMGDRYQVKRIVVAPGASLSLQRHVHRAEHWVVVRGVADVTIGDDVRRLAENQSTYIPQGQIHRLANPGKIPLELIEVQSGSYLGEDDIERLDDSFGRA